jgi:hypothetical protein
MLSNGDVLIFYDMNYLMRFHMIINGELGRKRGLEAVMAYVQAVLSLYLNIMAYVQAVLCLYLNIIIS